MTTPTPRIIDWPTTLRALRARQGWTQAQLAERVGATRRTIISYEGGASIPTGAYRKALQELVHGEAINRP